MKVLNAPPGTLSGLKQRVRQLQRIDVNSVSLPYLSQKYQALMRGVRTHWISGPGLNQVWRGRIGRYEKVTDLWYPPKTVVKSYGRANPPGYSVFYGSFGLNPRAGLIEELRAEEGQLITLMCCQLHPSDTDLPILGFGHVDKFMLQKSDDAQLHERYRNSDRARRQLCRSDIGFKKNEVVLDWLNEVFTKKSSSEHESQYMHTVAVLDAAIRGFGCEGIIYPSVASDRKSINVALAPKLVDRFYVPTSFRIVRLLERHPKVMKLQLVAESKCINSDGEIVWGLDTGEK